MGSMKDFRELKGLRKELEKETRVVAPVVEKKKVKVAAPMPQKSGLRPGCTVTLMDSNDRGILRHVHKDHVDIEIDGLIFTAGLNDFIVNDPNEDRELMRRAGSAKPVKEKPKKAVAAVPSEITLDLHIERIPGGFDAPKGFELPFQMEYFRRIIRQNLKYRGIRIIVVHGVGDGILRDAVRKEIDEVFAVSCTWSPGTAGVTVVTVR
ncbi:MAG: Smr/MutS family protein [Bacteroidales bacterium]|nr:Smr/MutS family protein [Candidatus Cryptobacteroides caccocaballi]